MRRAPHSIRHPWSFLLAAGKQARHILRYKLFYLAAEKNGVAYFYPEKPHPYTIAYKALHLNGIRVTAGLPGRSDPSPVIFLWEDSTVSRHRLPALSSAALVVNARCSDISKSLVGKIHSEVFGYQAEVDPLRHAGSMVAKSNENGTHSGEIVRGPLARVKAGWVYQRLIDNTPEALGIPSADTGRAVDLRVPVFGSVWQHAYIKYRRLSSRFGNVNDKVEFVKTDTLFTQSEVERLNEFCSRIGLDYGELDVVRDSGSKQIFVLDVNKTPLGPPNGLSKTDTEIALRAYKRSFLNFIRRSPANTLS